MADRDLLELDTLWLAVVGPFVVLGLLLLAGVAAVNDRREVARG